MPCRTYDDDYPEPTAEERKRTAAAIKNMLAERAYRVFSEKSAAAVLCGILSSMSGESRAVALGAVDWKEVGVTRNEFETWWAEHQRRDFTRRRAEEKRAAALAKLTPAERKLLGIK